MITNRINAKIAINLMTNARSKIVDEVEEKPGSGK